MDWLRKRRNKWMLSIITGLLLVSLSNVNVKEFQSRYTEKPQIVAWWGTLYPDFCFAEGVKEKGWETKFWLKEFLLRF